MQYILKTKKNSKQKDDNTVETIDYTTKKTINKINAEQDRKYKASKAYKKSTAFSNI